MKKLLLFVLYLAASLCIYAQRKTIIQIAAGRYDRENTPIRISLPKAITSKRSYELVDRKTGHSTIAQLLDKNTLIFIPDEALTAGSTHSYLLRPSLATFKQGAVNIEKQPDGLLVKVKNKPLLYYHTAIVNPPPDSPAYYQRSGFIHPLYSPDGKILTDDFPAGHVHQHAIFSAWTNTTFRNSFVDFWNQHLKKGTVQHADIIQIIEGPVCTQLKTLLKYISFEHGEVLSETWTLSFYPFSDYFMFDLESLQENFTSDTLYINAYHYGGQAFRGSKEWNPDDKVNFKQKWNILTSEGKRDSSANGTHAKWVDAYGMVDGSLVGVSVFNHPSNFRYPQAIRVHPTMPYWCYAPEVDGKFSINPSVPYISRFRYFVHNGNPDMSEIDRLQALWAEPPVIKVNYK